MKKVLVVFVVLALLAGGMVACKGGDSSTPTPKAKTEKNDNNGDANVGGGDIAEAKAMLTKAADLMEQLNKDLDKAASGKEAAELVTKFVAEMKKFEEAGKRFQKTIKDPEKVPELKEVAERVKTASKAFMGALIKMATRYKDDKDFQEAMKNMQNMK